MSTDRFLITKIALVFLLVFFFFAYLGMRYFSLPKPKTDSSTTPSITKETQVTITQESLEEPSISPAPLAKLQFNSTLTDTGVTTYEVGRTVKVDLLLSEKPVTAADIVINYDPQAVSINEIENGEVFDLVLKKNIDSQSGVITYSAALASDPSASPKLGKVLSFSLTPKLVGNTKLSLDSKATVLALSSVDYANKKTPLDFPIIVK